MNKLTKKQQKLLAEIKKISEITGFDYQNESIYKGYAKTLFLDRVIDQMTRSAIVMDYAVIDDYLNDIICQYFFGKKSNLIILRTTKKFKNFNFYILEKLYLLNKLDLVNNIIKIPKEICNLIHSVNDLRNGLTHTLFPENLRRNKPVYKGKSIYSYEGLRNYKVDLIKVHDFFWLKLSWVIK